MKEESFEEMFPSLAKVKCRTFTDKCLIKTCLDKQKVKEAIEKVSKTNAPHPEFGWKIKLKEELGLE